ncbi:hypothetical protein CBS101457_004867 [Exobasidium rhododendri]|nr:hypothetical protein CBS101457_004867 [Exobasidium rhododendri]
MSAPFNVILVGAGEINFGSPEGPWNHSARLESILGSRLCVLCVIDPDVRRSEERISERQQGDTPAAWTHTIAVRTLPEAKERLNSSTDVHLILLGCPPHFRGTCEKDRDMDLQVVSSFPHAKGLLIEKPVAALDPQVADCQEVAVRLHSWAQRGAVISVGYMLRYLSTVRKMKNILADNHLVPTCINARYYMAYENARKISWWDKSVSCGPVVEQATHFVDLVRFIAGQDNPVLSESVRAIAVEHDEEAGSLSKQNIEESDISPENRVPRVTTAFWKHEKGTLGTLCHGIALHDRPYDTELEVLTDGWVMKLKGAYSSSPSLSVLGPYSAAEEIISTEDDPFTSELEAIIQAIDGNDSGHKPILSTFEDALNTYVLTWKIRRASEQK